MNFPTKIQAVIRLIRVEHSLIGSIGVIVGAIVTTRIEHTFLNRIRLLQAALVVIFLIAGGFALNDYFDVDVDRKNRRFDRPIVTGDLTARQVLIGAIFAIIIGLILASFLDFLVLGMASIATFLATLYNFRLKEFGLLGNIYIASTYAAPWFFGGLLFSPKSSSAWIAFGSLSLITFVAGLGREILKGIMDTEGDALRNVRTVARKYGPKTAASLAVSFILVAVVLTPIPFFYAFNRSLNYLLLVSITDFAFLAVCISILRDQSYTNAKKARERSLLSCILGTFAFLAGAIDL
ncbi:MAG: UbiA family prenyltransferase [Candidatus Heimdallarchaeota archaeon]